MTQMTSLARVTASRSAGLDVRRPSHERQFVPGEGAQDENHRLSFATLNRMYGADALRWSSAKCPQPSLQALRFHALFDAGGLGL